MLVQSTKAGCSFEVSLANISTENDFVVIDERDGSPTSCHRMPKRLAESPIKPEMTLFDVVAKLQEAERRRELERNKIKSRAAIQNMKADIVVKEKQQSICDTYWALDAKLRDADKRREELVAKIRERAHETVARGEMVRNYINERHSQLDESLTASLMRATDNRNAILHDLKQRLHDHDVRSERVRKAHAVLEGKAIEGYWDLDQKLNSATHRRNNYTKSIREKASSPTARIEQIKEINKYDTKQQVTKLDQRIQEADHRRKEMHTHIKQRASQRWSKIGAHADANLENQRGVVNDKLRRATANREQHLREIRARQMEKRVKSERVRQAKRAIVAAGK